MNKLILLTLLSLPAFGLTCVAIGPAATGSGSGADWNNQKAPPATTAWVRGDLYYLADGNYGTHLGVTTTASGTTTIELRKAQPYDNGDPATGPCTNNISAGWNTATMGSSQAYFAATSGGSNLFSLTGYTIINGNGAGVSADPVGCGGAYLNPTSSNVVAPNSPAGCGIRIDDSGCTCTTDQCCGAGGNGVSKTSGDHVVLEYIEFFGNGGRGPSLSTAGGTYSNEYYWWWVQTPTNTIVTHNYYHNMMTCYILFVGGASGVSFDHNYMWGMYDQSTSHAEGVQLEGNNAGPININNNVFRDQTTNGDVVQVTTSASTDSLRFYNNIDFCGNGTASNDSLYGTSCNHTQGMLSCINAPATCTNWSVFNNTMAQVGGGSGGTFRCGQGGDASGDTLTGLSFENNLFYNCGGFTIHQGTGGTWDYNSYLNSGQSTIGAHDVSNGSSPNPFVALSNTAPNLALASDNALWNARTSLGSPYDTDILGAAFTSSRGAYQFVPSSYPGASANGGAKLTGGAILHE